MWYNYIYIYIIHIYNAWKRGMAGSWWLAAVAMSNLQLEVAAGTPEVGVTIFLGVAWLVDFTHK